MAADGWPDWAHGDQEAGEGEVGTAKTYSAR
jgi:hypothetical protein